MKKLTLMLIIVAEFAQLASLVFADRHTIKIGKQGHGGENVWFSINPENIANHKPSEAALLLYINRLPTSSGQPIKTLET